MSKPLVFFGSGPLATQTLKAIHKPLNVSAVVTKPQPEHGHKTTPPVIEYAQANGLDLHTPTSKQELSELFASSDLPSLCGIVVDYGLIIPQDVIDYFEHGIINSHFSLLPDWRGADPITFPILAGDKTTGVSLMQIVLKMDEGDVLAQSEIEIEDDDTSATMTDKLTDLSNQMLLEIIPRYINGEVQPIPQAGEPSYSRKLTKEDGLIDWSKPAEVLEREVRGFIIWPKSYTQLAGKDVVITKATTSDDTGDTGQTFVAGSSLGVYTGEGALIIEKLKVSGKPEMTSQAFINGYMK